MQIETIEQALTLTIKLAIQAPDEEMANRCIMMAESMADKMTEKDVELCQKAALAAIQYEEEYGDAD